MALSWFRSLLRKPQFPHRRGPARQAAFRPRLEGLETRLAPATWDGGGATNNWSDRFNWVGDAVPVTGNALVFPNTGVDPTSKNNVNDFNDNRAFSSITFSGQGYAITGQPIQILGGTISAGTGSNALNIDITFSTLTLSGVGTLTLGGALAGGNITKSGAGRAILTHDNPNFTGQMLVNGGAIVVSSSGALGASGSAANGTIVTGTPTSAARVELSGNGVDVGPEVLTLDGSATKLVNANGSGNNSWAGPIDFPGSGSATLRGITSLSGQLTLSGVISSSVAESGAPVIDIAGAGATVFAGSASTTHTGAIRVTGGHLVLQKSGGAQAVVGALDVINSGNVRWGDNEQISNAVTVKVEQGSLDLAGFTETIGPLNLDLAAITTGAGTLILSNTVTQGILSGPGGNSTIAGNVTMGGTSGTFTVNPTSSNGELVISAVIQGPSLKKLVKEGTGRLVLSGANQYTGQTVVNAGQLTITNAQALGGPNPSKAFFLQDGTDVKGGAALELRADAGNFVVAGEDLQFGGTGVSGRGGALRNLSGNNTWAGSVAFTPFFGNVMSVGVDGSSELALDGTTFGGGNGNVIKVGTGRLIFTGSLISDLASNGTFEVRQGTVNVRGSATVGSKSADVFVFSGAALELEDRTADFDQASVHLNGSGTGIAGALRLLNRTATASSPIFLDSNARIGVNPGAALTLTGAVSGALATEFRKMGSGNLILDAANCYAAATVVAQGTLTVRNAAALGTTTKGTIVHPGATLLIDRPITVLKEALTLGVATVAGEPILAGAGAPGESAEWRGAVTLNNAATIQVGGADVTLRLSGPITSAVQNTLTKKGAGTLSLTGSTANTALDGPVVVNDGTLGLNKPGGLQAIDGTLVIGDGTGASGSASVTQLNAEQVNNTKTVTVNRDGVFNLSDKNETIFRLTMAGGTVNTGTGTLTVSQLNAQASADTAFVNGKFKGTGNLLVIDVADGTAEPDLVINAVVSTFVNKTGAGSLVLNGNNTNGLRVLDGKTFVNGSQPAASAQLNGNTAGTSAELGGTGTVGGITLLNGTVNPGAAGLAGILTTSNGLTVSPSGAAAPTQRLEFDLNGGLVAGTNFDQLNVIGTVNLGTNLTELVVNTPDGFAANPGDAFVIINNDGTNDAVTGAFIGLAENSPLTINNQPFRISYRGVSGNDNDVVLIRDNSASMFPNRSLTPVVTEGGFATLTGTIGDADLMDFFILDVNWGDGTPAETHVFEPGSPRQLSLQHRYLNNPAGQISGQYQVHLQWRDQHGAGSSDDLAVTVQNANPTVSAGGDVTLGTGESLSRSGMITDDGVTDTFTATVDYGDGLGAENLVVLTDGSFQLQRSYARPGNYFVTVTATDSDGGVGRSTFTVTV